MRRRCGQLHEQSSFTFLKLKPFYRRSVIEKLIFLCVCVIGLGEYNLGKLERNRDIKPAKEVEIIKSYFIECIRLATPI